MSIRNIDASAYSPPAEPASPGAAPMLQWIKITDLVVDDRYQRPIAGAGRNNVKRIAAAFRWSKFAPVIVAPVEGGRFAIVDGQHRTTAAALLGFESVPTQVITADLVEQAAAFKSINGQVTKISRLSLHRAGVAAGDPEAVEIDRVATAAGVKILPYPVQAEGMKPGETIAIGAIASSLKAYGETVLVTALMCVTETTNNTPGALASPVIHALCGLLGANPHWRDAGGGLLAAFDEIEIDLELEEARITRRPKLTAIWEVLSDRLADRLRELLPAAGGKR